MTYRDRTATGLGGKFREPAPKRARFAFSKRSGQRREYRDGYRGLGDVKLGFKPPKPAKQAPVEAAPKYRGGTTIDNSLDLASVQLAGYRIVRDQDLGVIVNYINHGTISNAHMRDVHERNKGYEVLRTASEEDGVITFHADRANHVRAVRIERRWTEDAKAYAAALALASRLHNLEVLVAFRTEVVSASRLYTLTEPLESVGTLQVFELISVFPAIKAFFIRTFAALAHKKLKYQDLGFETCGYKRDIHGYDFRLLYPQNIVSDEHADADGWKAALHKEYARLRPPQKRGALFPFNTETRPVAGPDALFVTLDKILAELDV